MCFRIDKLYTKNFFVAEALIANRDIVVYKKLRKIGNELFSPFRHRYTKPWKKGIPHKASLVKSVKGTYLNNLTIRKGLHSYRLPLKSVAEFFHNNEEFYRAIIPKGSLYYINDTQYVSNALYITSERKITKNNLK